MVPVYYYVVDPGDHLVRASSRWHQLWHLPSGLGTVVQPDLVSCVKSSRVSGMASTGICPVAVNYHMLTGMVMDAVESFHEVRDIVGQRLLLAWGRPRLFSDQKSSY